MASVSVISQSKPNKDGSRPIAIQIIKNRNPSLIHIGYSVHPTDWNAEKNRVKKSHTNHIQLNHHILKKLSDATDQVIAHETHHPDATIAAIRQKIKPGAGDSFFDWAYDYNDLLKVGKKFNQHNAQKLLIDNFRKFMGSRFHSQRSPLAF